jgi:hypothetical protein
VLGEHNEVVHGDWNERVHDIGFHLTRSCDMVGSQNDNIARAKGACGGGNGDVEACVGHAWGSTRSRGVGNGSVGAHSPM